MHHHHQFLYADCTIRFLYREKPNKEVSPTEKILSSSKTGLSSLQQEVQANRQQAEKKALSEVSKLVKLQNQLTGKETISKEFETVWMSAYASIMEAKQQGVDLSEILGLLSPKKSDASDESEVWLDKSWFNSLEERSGLEQGLLLKNLNVDEKRLAWAKVKKSTGVDFTLISDVQAIIDMEKFAQSQKARAE